MKVTYPLAIVAATVAILGSSVALHASETDDRIESSFKKSFVYKTYLKDEKIKINSKDGIVTLTGEVFNGTHKPMAQDTAEALPGVKSVDNQLKVAGEQPAEHSDTWIATKVKSALLFHRNVSATATTVTVRDGVVSLTGEASSQAQKDLTGEYAKDIDNVKDVQNNLTVAAMPAKPSETMGEKIDDASITAEVKSSLLSHRSTSVLKTGITTTDGVVTVTGVAKNEAEKSLVTKLATDITGVTSVVNNMTILVPVASN